MCTNNSVDLICSPIKDLETLLSWKVPSLSWAENAINIQCKTSYRISGKDWNCKSERVKNPVKLFTESVPKTLLCHDMKGGYLNDRFVNGAASCDDYKFIHWAALDIFVYFSHEFVTIPPLAWINAAHHHGVHILGTIITENDEGKKCWETILSNEEVTQQFIIKLTALCTHYRFDGYLLNVENVINAEHTDALVKFVSRLKNCLGNEKFVIWYDAVIHPDGLIKWQDELNNLNRKFFEACDGIYLNYCWTEAKLAASAERAGARKKDVFVGVDVFGRGCYGGGGFNTEIAISKIREYNLSVAIFAPAWTHECQNESLDFVSREMRFWEYLWPHLYLHGPAALPFCTTFCQGTGLKVFREGEVLSNAPWYNLAKQDYQPTRPSCSNFTDTEQNLVQCLTFDYNIAYKGGCSLRLSKHPNVNFYRLFICEFMNDGSITLKLSLAVKPLETKQAVNYNLILTVSDASNFPGILAGANSNKTFKDKCLVLKNGSFLAKEEDYSAIVINSESSKEVNDWTIDLFKFNYRGILTDISIAIPEDCGPFLIGLLQLERNHFIIADDYF